MWQRFTLVCGLVICLFCVAVQFAHAGNELRPGEEIWECGDYAWRSLSVPVLDLPGEYDDTINILAVDPDNRRWINSRYWYGDDYETGTWYNNDITFDGVDFEGIESLPPVCCDGDRMIVARDRISGDGYAAWIKVKYNLLYHGFEVGLYRYQDGETTWYFRDFNATARDIGVDSSGLVWIVGRFGYNHVAYRVSGDPNLDESWSVLSVPGVRCAYDIDCGGGRMDRCLLGCSRCGIVWADEATTSGTIIDLEAVGGSNNINDVAVRVSDKTAWVASDDGLYGYGFQDGDCWMIDSYTPPGKWKRCEYVCSDRRENVWGACHAELVLRKGQAWRRFPFPCGGWPYGLVSDNDGVPWVEVSFYKEGKNKILALYWQKCELCVRTDHSEYMPGDVVEMVWSMKNLGPTVVGPLYVGVITPSDDVLCWNSDGWHAGLVPVLRDATYIPGLMFKPITFATPPITQGTEPGEYRLATAILSTSGTVIAYDEFPFTVAQEAEGRNRQ